MSSLKMTFSLTSLILIFALALGITSVAHADSDFGSKTIDDMEFIKDIPITEVTLPEATGVNTTPANAYTLPSLPNGLAFDSATRKLSGTPTAVSARATYTYTGVAATGDSDTIIFTIEVKDNVAPKFADGAKIDDQVFKIGKGINVTGLPVATDGDTGDTLTYTITDEADIATGNAKALPDGVLFDAFQRRFVGSATTATPATDLEPANVANITYYYTATDKANNRVKLAFKITVEADAKPTFGSETIADMTFKVSDEPIEDTFLPAAMDANTGETAKLVYTLAPTTLPAGLEYIASARLLRGTPTAVKAETEYTYTATDPDGNTAELKFDITVRADPVFADSDSIRDYIFVIGTEVDAGPFPTATDADDDIDAYSLSPQPPDGIAFVESLRKLVGNPTTAMDETEYTYTVTDEAGGTDTLTFNITVSATAPDPVATAPAKPDAPTAAINTDNDLVIDVSWTAPDDGDSAITGYTVKKYGSDGTLVKTFPEAGEDAITDTMLSVGPVPEADRGMSFTFTVTATNAEGDSDESDMSAAVMIPEAEEEDPVLPQPTDVATEAKTDGSIDVTWAWTGTDEQMDALDGFTVSWTYNPTMTADVAADARMYNIPADMLSVGRDTTVTVMAREKSGSGFGSSPPASPPAPAIPMAPPVNSPPVFTASAAIADISARVGIAYTSPALPEAADADGETLTYSLDPMLDGTNGLTFDAATRMISGTPNAAMAQTQYTYKASDGTDEAMLMFNITIAANSAPAFSPDTPVMIPAREGFAMTAVTLPLATDADADSVTHSLTPALPAGLTRSGADMNIISGTPTAAAIGTHVHTWTATDGITTTPLSVTITVAADAAPTFGGATISTIAATNGTAITPQILPEATDDDGDAITYTLTPAPPTGLTFDATSRLLSGTPSVDSAPTIYTYTAETAGKDASLSFVIEVKAAPPVTPVPNNTPTFGGATISTVSATVDMAITPQLLPEATDADAGDTITYSLTPALPTGVTFNTATRLLSGTPTAVMAAAAYTYTATDNHGASATLSFVIEVKAAPPVTPVPNNLPTFGGQTIAAISGTVGTMIAVTLPEATDADGDAITYSILQTLPTGLTFNAVTRYLSGTPSAAAASANYTYVASDGKGGTAALNFALEVVEAPVVTPPANNAPTFGTATISTVSATAGTAITPQILPMATDADGDAITYTLLPAPPAGVTFDATTRLLSGTPTAAMAATAYTYTASDGTDSATLSFVIEVQAAPTVPTIPSVEDDDLSAAYLNGVTTISSGMIAANGFATIGDMNLPDLEEFFDIGGTIGLSNGDTTDDKNSRTVVISEILWGLDLGAPVGAQTKWQFIELYNTTGAAIDLSNWTLTFTEGRPVPAIDIDQVSNRSGTGWNLAKGGNHGQSGRVTGTLATDLASAITPTNIISMYRNINYDHVEAQVANRGELVKGIPGGNGSGSWKASQRRSEYNRWIYDSKRREHFKATAILTVSSVARSPFIINEIGNGTGDTNDWVEIRNVTGSEASLKNYHLSAVTGFDTDTSLVNFHDKDIKVPGNGVILLVNTDPKNTDIAAGRNAAIAEADQELTGVQTRYYVNSNLKLPDDGKFNLILRNAHDKLKASSHFMDVVGGLVVADANKGTSLWPLVATGGPHGDVIEANGRDLKAPRVYIRKNAGGGTGEHHLGLVGYTGVGYDRIAAKSGENGGTPGYDNGAVKEKIADLTGADSTAEITISEIMLESKQGRLNLPQWIELYNSSMTHSVNTNGWKLHVENANDVNTSLDSVLTLDSMTIPPNQTILIVTNTGRVSDPDHFPSTRLVNLWTTKKHRDALEMTRRTDQVFSQTGLYLKLTDKDNKLVDEFGNLDGNRRTRDAPNWTIPMGEDDERRSSLIRVYDNGVAITGTMEDAWVLADATNLAYAISQTFYGDADDFGTPGFRGGGPVPVSLSKFRPERLDTGEIVIRWITESELNNAGFNILRSEKRDGEFTKVHFQAGQGTTSERTAYEWKDTTATKPNVVYYYQIQDVSLDGKVTTLRQSRLKGDVSPDGKVTTTWGEIKALQ